MGDADDSQRLPSRREPPPLISATLVERHEITARLLRLTFEGSGLEPMLAEPAASIRLLVPSPGAAQLVLPQWNGNEFLLPGDIRPALRTFTPLRSAAPGRLDLEVVRHPGGVVSAWAENAPIGADVAISGPGRGFEPPADATDFHLFGDETATPAIGQLLTHLPRTATIHVELEVETDSAIRKIPHHPGATISWHALAADQQTGSALIAAVRRLENLAPSAHIWAAGEAAAMQAIRKLLFNERGLERSQATIRGYWKPERSDSTLPARHR